MTIVYSLYVLRIYNIRQHEEIWSTSNDDIKRHTRGYAYDGREKVDCPESRDVDSTSRVMVSFCISYGRVCYHLRKKNHRQLSTALCHFVR